MKINCYGEAFDGTPLGYRKVCIPLERKRVGKWTFARYTEGEKVVIHRFGIGADGAVEETWSYGKWVEAENLAYIPLSETLEVEP